MTEEKIKKIPFDFTIKLVGDQLLGYSITKCPFGDNSFVGSAGCRMCPAHLSLDVDQKIVCCVGAQDD